MSSNIFIIKYYIQGKEIQIEVNVNQPLKVSVEKALKSAGITGNINGWEVRTEDGSILNLSSKISDLKLTPNQKLYLSKGAGRGG